MGSSYVRRKPFEIEFRVEGVPDTLELAFERKCYGAQPSKWIECEGCGECNYGLVLTDDGKHLLEFLKRWSG